MKLCDIARTLALTCLTPSLVVDGENEVSGGYASDLLSDVLANAPSGGVLVTIQAHLNTVAVALHARQCAIIFATGRSPDRDVIARAEDERLPLYVSQQSTFEVVGRLYALGLRSERP
jgi:hypothetical protein